MGKDSEKTKEIEEKTKTKSIRIPIELVETLEKKAQASNRSFSNLVIHILTKYLDMVKDD